MDETVLDGELRRLLKQNEPKLIANEGLADALKAMEGVRAMMPDYAALEAVTSAASLAQRFQPDHLKRITELASVFEETQRYLARAAEMARAAGITATLEKLQEAEQFAIPVFPKLAFPVWEQIDWDAITERQRHGAILLADKGWTVPAWMPLPVLSGLGTANDSEIEDYFLKSYLGSNVIEGELKRTSSDLLAGCEMDRWKSLLEEVFECIQNQKYKVSIPSLLTIIEGFTMDYLYRQQKADWKSTKVKRAVENAKWHEEENLNGVLWTSVVIFLNHLFANSDFDSTRPTFINRHWILHGRTATDWTAADALKLVNALATVHWLST